MDTLAPKFFATHTIRVMVEIDRLSSELIKLEQPSVFVAR
jgi:hypothetical protein